MQTTKLINLINPTNMTFSISNQLPQPPVLIVSHRRVSVTSAERMRTSFMFRIVIISTLYTSTVAPRATLIIFTNPPTTRLPTNHCTIVAPRSSMITTTSRSILTTTIAMHTTLLQSSQTPQALMRTTLVSSWTLPTAVAGSTRDLTLIISHQLLD